MSASTGDILSRQWDVVVVGTGAAALTAALSAATTTTSSSTPTSTSSQRNPPRILLIDKAPADWAGGNGHFTAAAYRTQHHGLKDLLPLVSNVPPELEGSIDLPAYTHEDFHHDLQRVTAGRSDPGLGKVLVDESLDLVKWLKDVGGVDWWLSFKRQAYQVEGRWVFWGGLHLTVAEGGKGLIRSLRRAVEDAGCTILHDCAAAGLIVDDDGNRVIRGLQVQSKGQQHTVRVSSVVMCAGGFEANPDLRKKYLGAGWELAHTRGTPYNTGDMLLTAASLGAKLVGDFSPGGCHSVAWDANSPKEGGDREKTNEFTKSGYPLGLMLNAQGIRFVDEGVDLRNYTYAKFGRAILEQPKGIAFQVWDKNGQEWLRAEEYRDDVVEKITADSLQHLASKCVEKGLDDEHRFVETIRQYNGAVAAFKEEFPSIRLNPAIKDGLSTQSSRQPLQLPKSNWAIPIKEPPFLAVKVTSGITFTFGGLGINPSNAAVLKEDGSEFEGLYCAGEMVGGLFWDNYPGGSGLTAGGVFGRRAGRAAIARASRAGV